jgi:hypothetical protein
VTPLGAAAKERPLPVGALPSLRIGVRNTGTGVLAKIVLTARFEGMQAENSPGWRPQGGALILEIPRLGAGEQTERMLRLRVGAPTSGKTTQVSIEARTEDGAVAAGEASLRVADCVGVYRSKLSALRSGALQAVRDAAEAMRKPDPALPNARLFPATGVKTGNVAVAERFAAAFARYGGADPEMSSEDSRFTIQRWTSELSAYAGQEANPGLCAGNYYMVAGQREGILPISRRLQAMHTAAANALEAARQATKAEAPEDLGKLAGRAAKAAGLETGENASALATLAAARAARAKDRKLPPEQADALSLVETAAWLAETDQRGQALAITIERIFSSIAAAHKESCVCAF